MEQIFVAVTPDKEHKKQMTSKLDSLSKNIKTDKEFIQAIFNSTTDKQAATRNSKKKWVSVLGLDDKIKDAFGELTPGKISKPVADEKEIAIYRIESIDENRKLSLADDWNTIAKMAKQYYSEKLLNKFIKKWRNEMYIDNRL